jgi:hypothetical protein
VKETVMRDWPKDFPRPAPTDMAGLAQVKKCSRPVAWKVHGF